jgi:aryl-alcohol dehydrogenase-like predicted oxidoreductase
MAVYLNSAKTAMRYNNLGASGLMVSELSFGCMVSATTRADCTRVRTDCYNI